MDFTCKFMKILYTRPDGYARMMLNLAFCSFCLWCDYIDIENKQRGTRANSRVLASALPDFKNDEIELLIILKPMYRIPMYPMVLYVSQMMMIGIKMCEIDPGELPKFVFWWLDK